VKRHEYSKDAYCFVFVQQSKPIKVLVQPSQQIMELDFPKTSQLVSTHVLNCFLTPSLYTTNPHVNDGD
jgi:hypothetical protein